MKRAIAIRIPFNLPGRVRSATPPTLSKGK
jgi:hypothetical protein